MRKLIFLLLFLVQITSFGSCNQGFATNDDVLSEPEITIHMKKVPVFLQKSVNEIAVVNIPKTENTQYERLTSATLRFSNDDVKNTLKKIQLLGRAANNAQESLQIGETSSIGKETTITVDLPVSDPNNSFSFSFEAQENTNIENQIQLETVILEFDHNTKQSIQLEKNTIRIGHIVRQQGQDNCDTYRIPGMVTTNKGTLIAVYDARYNNSKDLQEDIDIGMSRSTDGGQTWEPMKIIMDMGEWGGRSQRLNGIGDPCVLYDNNTNTIWVAALWISGATEKDMLWWASKPGISPEETGQFILAKSTDDGLTWSEPINITEQIKDPAWQLLLQGPGRGICTDDGTLVFPAQFKSDTGDKALDGGQFTCHSTIVYSKDQGETWEIGTGAKTNTTEAQVVELPDGSLMLNMRDDRNRKDKGDTNGRAVSVSNDWGKTWEVHPSSNHALPESNCMASIIGTEVTLNGSKKNVLFFSNPNNKNERKNMTIKASLDNGLTWPEELQVELNEQGGYGYSCLTMVDDETIGILYEGVKELYFQKIAIADILKNK
ncbi:sialidase family protein [Draconibacterium sediminis]|uniref:exo-alpha-sialidase n=1 Tax=Draconibacterium sediminis TaxID=1544798 RepID=A0A0D8J7I0_9BACT|nr:sialidase family protein [Draconibacterium sediminis]KJF42837.1 sialidase [Draconibacterium sediminis]